MQRQPATTVGDRQYAAPFLKWAGGKAQLLSELDRHVPEFTRYFEPFLGGGAFFFHLASGHHSFKAFLSDANAELVNAYRVVKQDVEQLITSLDRHWEGYRRNPVGYYYSLRNSIPVGRVEQAARVVALNKTCYNGLYRVNSKGVFNVPIGRYKNPLISDRDQLKNASAALHYANAEIRRCDYRQRLKDAQRGDFVYLDPPFFPTSATAKFVDYTQDGFTEQDHVELAATFRELDVMKCKVLLSNSNTDLTRRLYDGFRKSTVQVTRAISCKATARSGYTELLVRNYEL